MDCMEQVIERMKVRQRHINELQNEQDADIKRLQSPDMVDTDLLTVKLASIKYGVSVCTLYNQINSGKLHGSYKAKKLYISRKEYESLHE